MVSDDAEPGAVVDEVEDGEAAGLLISFKSEVLIELRVLAIVPMRCYRQSYARRNMVPGWDIIGLSRLQVDKALKLLYSSEVPAVSMICRGFRRWPPQTNRMWT